MKNILEKLVVLVDFLNYHCLVINPTVLSNLLAKQQQVAQRIQLQLQEELNTIKLQREEELLTVERRFHEENDAKQSELDETFSNETLRLHEEQNALQMKIVSLEEELNSVQVEYDALKIRYDKMFVDVDEYKLEIQNLNRTNLLLLEQNKLIETTNSSINAENRSAIETANSSINAENRSAIETTNSSINAENRSATETTNSSINPENRLVIEELDRNMTNVMADIKEKNKEIKQLVETIDEHEMSIKNMTLDSPKHTAENDEEMDSVEQRSNALHQEIQMLRYNLDDAKGEVQHLCNERDRFASLSNVLNNELKALKSELESENTAGVTSNKVTVEVQEKFNESLASDGDGKMSNFQEEIEKLRKENSDLNKQLKEQKIRSRLPDFSSEDVIVEIPLEPLFLGPTEAIQYNYLDDMDMTDATDTDQELLGNTEMVQENDKNSKIKQLEEVILEKMEAEELLNKQINELTQKLNQVSHTMDSASTSIDIPSSLEEQVKDQDTVIKVRQLFVL